MEKYIRKNKWTKLINNKYKKRTRSLDHWNRR